MNKCHLLFGVINSDFSSKFNTSRTPSNNQNGTSRLDLLIFCAHTK
ncbi:unnamed protein product, partial [Linum tenue]